MQQDGKIHIAVLGSTGSIGCQTLDVVSQHTDMFEVELLTANSNSELLIKQALEFKPNSVVICDGSKYRQVSDALDKEDIKVFAGMESVCDIVQSSNIDIVVAAIVGFAGLSSAIAAIKTGKTVALANKETLVAAGSLVMGLAAENGARIVPVDSEHSAIFQCLQGNDRRDVEKLLLTCSGGPFLNKTKEEIAQMTPEAALKHPRWRMGAKVTIDSASLMNKGLEMIEARWLFDMPAECIQVVVHPESIIHSAVQYRDGAVIAQLSVPDMRIPIQYALGCPRRLDLNSQRMDFAQLGKLTFLEPDTDRFPCLDIAGRALSRGGNATCAMNAANEEAVAAFLQGRITFTRIPEIISETMARTPFVAKPTLEDVFETNSQARAIARKMTN
ncbi:MAG: 1-deoxy-D-xylulose-5-phosphate reductoisomerase [Bacteroidales bacterium]|nr:1-deoxy-D-xylulose-5-phosphate reductoisomerase [Bacteroidales bacterium]